MFVETVKIVSDNPDHGGYVEINKADYDPEKHELYEGETAPEVQPPHVTTATATDQEGAETDGRPNAPHGGASGAGWGNSHPEPQKPASGAETGAETVVSGQGADSVAGGDAADTLSGGQGGETVAGGNGSDSVTGAAGNDTVKAKK